MDAKGGGILEERRRKNDCVWGLFAPPNAAHKELLFQRNE